MAASLPRAQLVAIISALLLGTLMTSLSQLIVVTALPLVVASLGGLDLYSWVFAAALLASTVVVPIGGKLSDLYGRRKVYLTGMVVFMGGSALCGAAQSIEQLIVFRAIQGMGAGCVQPAVSALLADLFPPEQRGRWQGINGAIWGLSSVVGPILGGYLAQHVDWRWIFYVNLPPGCVAALVMACVLPGSLRGTGATSIDYRGMALLSGSIVAFLMTTLVGGRLFPWISPQTAALLGLSAACLVAFLRHERTAADPVLPLGLFASRTYQTVIGLVFLTGAGLFGAITYAPLYLQAVLEVSPMMTGLLFAPVVVVMSITSAIAGIYMHKIGYRRLAFVTMAASAAGFVVMAALSPDAGTLPIVMGLSIIGGGIGVSFPVFVVLAQNVVEQSVVGVATSTVQLTRSLGGAAGVALLGAYMGVRLGDLLAGSGQREIASLLRPEALAALSAADVANLRAQLADAIRGTFAVGAVVLTASALLTWRIEAPPGRQPTGARDALGSHKLSC
jgi:EmrB/QacA subfamily drug resistance transporter